MQKVPQSSSQLGSMREAQIASVAASVAAAASVAKAAVEAAKAIAEASNEALAQLGAQNDHAYQNSIEGSGLLPAVRLERMGVRDDNPLPLQVGSTLKSASLVYLIVFLESKNHEIVVWLPG